MTEMNTSKFNKTTVARALNAGRLSLAATFMAVFAAALAGCAGPSPSAPPEQVVRQLATQRWQALLLRDFAKAYEFAVPSYRALKNVDFYKRNREATPVKWISAEVFGVQCETVKCVVRIKLESKPVLPFNFQGTIEGGIDETWVLEGGTWWMFETL